VLLLMF